MNTFVLLLLLALVACEFDKEEMIFRHFQRFVKKYNKQFSSMNDYLAKFNAFKQNLLTLIENDPELHEDGAAKLLDLTPREFAKTYLNLNDNDFLNLKTAMSSTSSCSHSKRVNNRCSNCGLNLCTIGDHGNLRRDNRCSYCGLNFCSQGDHGNLRRDNRCAYCGLNFCSKGDHGNLRRDNRCAYCGLNFCSQGDHGNLRKDNRCAYCGLNFCSKGDHGNLRRDNRCAYCGFNFCSIGDHGNLRRNNRCAYCGANL